MIKKALIGSFLLGVSALSLLSICAVIEGSKSICPEKLPKLNLDDLNESK